MNDDLKALKAGDLCAIRGQYGAGHTIEAITKVTQTQIVIGNSRYKRTTGKLCGSSRYSSRYVVLVTPKIQAEVAARRLAYRLSKLDVSKLPPGGIDAMNDLLDGFAGSAELKP